VQFAPANLYYPELPKQLIDAKLSTTAGAVSAGKSVVDPINKWSDVKDFHYLHSGSPNWSLLPDDKRVLTFYPIKPTPPPAASK
jgi:hypothetical protein